jgi:hypothetical protein
MCCGWDKGRLFTWLRLACEDVWMELVGEGRVPSLLCPADMRANTSAAKASLNAPVFVEA